jgi:hypothetical protein
MIHQALHLRFETRADIMDRQKKTPAFHR